MLTPGSFVRSCRSASVRRSTRVTILALHTTLQHCASPSFCHRRSSSTSRSRPASCWAWSRAPALSLPGGLGRQSGSCYAKLQAEMRERQTCMQKRFEAVAPFPSLATLTRPQPALSVCRLTGAASCNPLQAGGCAEQPLERPRLRQSDWRGAGAGGRRGPGGYNVHLQPVSILCGRSPL